LAGYDVRGLAQARGFDCIVLVQSDFYDFIESRLAIPLFVDLSLQIDEIFNPVISVGERSLLLKTEFLGPFSAKRIGPVLGSLEDKSYEITRAIDRLMSGF